MSFNQFLMIALIVVMIGVFQYLAITGRQKVSDILVRNGFHADYIRAGGHFKTGVAIDVKNNGVAILRPMFRDPVLLDFSEIIAVEIRRNEQTIERTNRKRQLAGAAVGKVVFGNVGAVVLGVTASKRHETEVKKLSLLVFSSDFDVPCTEIVFHSGGSSALNVAERELNEWYGRFLAIVKNGE